MMWPALLLGSDCLLAVSKLALAQVANGNPKRVAIEDVAIVLFKRGCLGLVLIL